MLNRFAWHDINPSFQKKGYIRYDIYEIRAYIVFTVQMIVEELIEEGKPIPEPQTMDVRVFTEQKVMVTV